MEPQKISQYDKETRISLPSALSTQIKNQSFFQKLTCSIKFTIDSSTHKNREKDSQTSMNTEIHDAIILPAELAETANQSELCSREKEGRRETKKTNSEEISANESHDKVLASLFTSASVDNEGTNILAQTKKEAAAEDSSSGRERLKRHRVEVAGQIWIPETWDQEDLLKDWTDSTAFNAALINSSIMSARASLVEEGRSATSTRLRIENSR